MNVTAILCTYNRCESLRSALESLAATEMSINSWEVLVVDNNSNDQTRSVVETFVRAYPGRFRYLIEPRPGKSHALNSGIRHSTAEILAFVDDDVVVDRRWLQLLVAPLVDGPWAGVGGKILPDWKCSPPAWLPINDRYGLAPLAGFDLGPVSGPLLEAPFGTNMAFRRRVFEQYSGFRTDLGPSPGTEIRNEDTEFGQRLLTAGERLWYEPSAVVYHAVPAKRLHQRYFLTWWFDKARADARQFGCSDSQWLIAGVPAKYLRKLAVSIVRWLFTIGASARFSRKLKVWTIAGAISESRSHARNATVENVQSQAKSRV